MTNNTLSYMQIMVVQTDRGQDLDEQLWTANELMKLSVMFVVVQIISLNIFLRLIQILTTNINWMSVVRSLYHWLSSWTATTIHVEGIKSFK